MGQCLAVGNKGLGDSLGTGSAIAACHALVGLGAGVSQFQTYGTISFKNAAVPDRLF